MYIISERGINLSQKEKLIKKLKSKSKNMTFSEIEVLLNSFGYKCFDKGHTSGSRVIFESDAYPPILLHKPHQRKELLEYQIKEIIKILKQEGLI